MSTLSVPVDFERLPEYRSLQSHLLLKLSSLGAVPAGQAESLAAFIFFRLWVDLSYQAQVTKPLGTLPPDGVSLFLNSLGPEISKLEPMALLTKSAMLKFVGEVGSPDEGYYCDRFAKCNPHLSPDFRSGQVKGAEHSAFKRGQTRMAHEALQQSLMLEPAILKRRNGEPLHGKDANRVLMIVRTLDNCLRLPSRKNTQVTEGLIADAAYVMESYTPEQFESVCLWIIDHRDHPALPKTTEQLLSDFGALAKLVANP